MIQFLLVLREDQLSQIANQYHYLRHLHSRIRDSGHHRRHILLVLVLLRRRRRRISSCSSMSSRSSSLSSVGGDLTDANYKSDVIIPLHPLDTQYRRERVSCKADEYGRISFRQAIGVKLARTNDVLAKNFFTKYVPSMKTTPFDSEFNSASNGGTLIHRTNFGNSSIYIFVRFL
ncbi:unnamed protein product [Adineta ricciae]|uniref:Uncharacterized protein n=1 Tax=Adineta ricciae TaxID=249248 RepID=A0A815PC87_ADIRI|nr:unnamed protein product [Adineta ricciae]